VCGNGGDGGQRHGQQACTTKASAPANHQSCKDTCVPQQMYIRGEVRLLEEAGGRTRNSGPCCARCPRHSNHQLTAACFSSRQVCWITPGMTTEHGSTLSAVIHSIQGNTYHEAGARFQASDSAGDLADIDATLFNCPIILHLSKLHSYQVICVGCSRGCRRRVGACRGCL
jgi:hypothetical protein